MDEKNTSLQKSSQEKGLQANEVVSNELLVTAATALWHIEYDEKGEISSCKWSSAFRKILGYDSQEDFPDVWESWLTLIHPDDKAYVEHEYTAVLQDYTGAKIYDIEYRMRSKQGGYRWYRDVAHITRRADGTPLVAEGVVVLEKSSGNERLRLALREAEKANRESQAKTEILRRTEEKIYGKKKNASHVCNLPCKKAAGGRRSVRGQRSAAAGIHAACNGYGSGKLPYGFAFAGII